MNRFNPEYESSPDPNKNEEHTFEHKFKDLLPGVEFEESADLLEARTAILEALTNNGHDPEFLRSVWAEYANVCEQAVDSRTDTDPQNRAQLQIATLVHKALIFRKIGDIQHYSEDLSSAEEYAWNMHFDEIAETIAMELDHLEGLGRYTHKPS